MKKSFSIGLLFALCFVLLGATGCASRGEVVKKVMENAELTVTIPDNLLSCPAEYVAAPLSEDVAKTCADSTGTYCSYYTKTKNGVTTNHNLEYTSECTLCQAHKQTGEVFKTDDDGTVYTHKGYEKADCKGGLYPAD